MNINRLTLLPLLAGAAVMTGCADTGDLVTTGSTAATSAMTTHEANENDYARAREFARSQHVALRRDAAAGEGEHLDAFAALMREDNSEAFGGWLQSHYSVVFDQAQDQGAIVDRILALRASSATIARAES
ncbi:MAG: hypothetical protein CMN28_07615 [Salinisphaeraceae bacterium]|jgi:hypothetical protein|nr:hypothetical protein [Salinisphaeraceae bacterium]